MYIWFFILKYKITSALESYHYTCTYTIGVVTTLALWGSELH